MAIIPVNDFWLNKSNKILTQLPAHLFDPLGAEALPKVFYARKDK